MTWIIEFIPYDGLWQYNPSRNNKWITQEMMIC